MSELTFNLLRLGYLLLLWLFVFSAVAVLRRDISIRGRSAATKADEEPGSAAWVNPSEAPITNEVPASPSPVPSGGWPGNQVSVPVPTPATSAPIVVGPGAAASGAPVSPPPEPIVVGPPRQPRYLSITTGALAGSMLPLTGLPITIGRAASNTLVFDDDYASGHHARLYPAAEGWVVEDLNSTNGTFLGGAPLTGAAVLPVGVPVTIGHSTFELVM